MPRWLRVLRAMAGMGVTFAAGGFLLSSALVGLGWLLRGRQFDGEPLIVIVGSSVWSFLIGVVFSGFLMLVARGRPIEKLSLPLFAALGATGGLLLYGVLALNAWQAWSASSALVNLILFLILGTGSATATLLVARRRTTALNPGNERHQLEEG